MSAVSIERLHARYRLVGAPAHARERLDAILAGVLDGPLERALGSTGTASDEQLCVRFIHAPVRLRLECSDSALADAWSRALADAISRAVADGGADVVRYRSRRHALADVVLGVARQDLGRAWAWRRLGLWPATGVLEPDAGVATEAVVSALEAHGDALVAVLADAARRGALGPLAATLVPSHWRRLAAAAAAVAGDARALVLDDSVVEAGGAAGNGRRAATGEPAALARRVLGRSSIARAAEAAAERSPESARPIAVLACLEAEPDVVAVRRTQAQAVIEAVASELRHPTRSPAVERSTGAKPPRPDDPRAAADSDAAAAAVEPLATTEWGGLVFLLNLVEAFDLLAKIAAAEVLGKRSLRWVLHRLALELVPVTDDDPAALALSGLPPGEQPPSLAEEAPRRDELSAVAALAVEVAGGLAALLESEDDGVVREVANRRARVVGDLGWIELHFDLADVSVELRRAGLDLDPGYVPWLGAVVRFAYV